MRFKRLSVVAAVAALPLVLGVLPAGAEEITGELGFDDETQTYTVDGTELELTEEQLESTEFGDLDGDGDVEPLSDELDGVLALEDDAPELTVTIDDETGAVTALVVAEDDGEGDDGDGDDADEQDSPDPEQLPEQASDTAVSVLTVISQWEGERGCEFGHAVAEAAGGSPEGDCPDAEDEENGSENDAEALGGVESQGGPETGAEQAEAGQARGQEGRARGAAAAEAGRSNGQGDDEDAGPPEDVGPPEDPGPPEDAGPPEDPGPPSSNGGS